jgi:hypothetical protein
VGLDVASMESVRLGRWAVRAGAFCTRNAVERQQAAFDGATWQSPMHQRRYVADLAQLQVARGQGLLEVNPEAIALAAASPKLFGCEPNAHKWSKNDQQSKDRVSTVILLGLSS